MQAGWTPGASQTTMLPPTQMLPPPHSYELPQRTFHTFDFYKKHQEAMTPAGLAFFQCRWDDSVTHTFHQLLGKGSGRPGGQDLSCHARRWSLKGGKCLAEFQPHRQGGPSQQESTPIPLLFLQTCGNLCMNLYGHPLTTPTRSASPTSSPYAIWTDTETVMSPPMESTERHSTFISEGELTQLEGHTSGASYLKPTETVPCWPLPGDPGACCGGTLIICE